MILLALIAGAEPTRAVARAKLTPVHDPTLTGVAEARNRRGGVELTITLADAPPGVYGVHLAGGDDATCRARIAALDRPDRARLAKRRGTWLGNLFVEVHRPATFRAHLPGLSLGDARTALVRYVIVVHLRRAGRARDRSEPRGACGELYLAVSNVGGAYAH